MQELELSVMSYGTQSVDKLQALLQAFEARHQIQIRISTVRWENSWAEIMQYALYGHGPAVSEVGDTWVASLVAMNALRRFEPHELMALGGEDAFLSSVWQTGALQGAVWAIPWLAETRVIFYRRDWLEAAKIDAQTAFSSAAQFEQTLDRLRSAGMAAPLTINTRQSLNSIHNIAAWVWGAGGDFIDRAGQRVAFHQPQARAGMAQYYGLHTYLSPEARHLTISQSDELFQGGTAAVTLSGPWLALLPQRTRAPEVAAEVGAALPPGIPFVGGSHLVIWWSVPPQQQALAVELIRFLTEPPVQLRCSQQTGLLPARLGVLANAPDAIGPLHQTMEHGLRIGRSFPAMRLWGMIEGKLADALNQIWEDVLAQTDPDIDALIQSQLNPLAQRINWIMASDTARRT